MKRFAARYLFDAVSPEPLLNGFVETGEDGTVIRVGKCNPSDEPDFYEGALTPGFVNAHCHIELSSMKGLFRKGSGMAGFIDQINALRDTRTRDEKIGCIKAWMDTLWERGVSAMSDISNCDDSFDIKSAHPIYTRTFLEVFGTEPGDAPAVMEGVRELGRKAAEAGIDAAPTPHSPYTMSPELLTESSREGLASGFLSYHCGESSEEEDMIRRGAGAMWENRRRAGMSTPPVEGLSSLEYFLSRLRPIHEPPFPENVLLVHECTLDEAGADLVKASFPNAFIALCPLSNIFIHNTLPPVPMMQSKGLRLCIGTDSLSSNDDLDMVKEMFCLQENFPGLGLGEMLGWACANGAAFLRRNELGSFVPGKRPGVVLIDHIAPGGRLSSASRSHRLI